MEYYRKQNLKNKMPTTITTATSKDIIVKQLSITLNDAQIKSLPTSGIELLPSLEPNKMYVPINAAIIFDTESGAYGNVGSQVGGGLTAFTIGRNLSLPPFSQVEYLLSGNKGVFVLVNKTTAYKAIDPEVVTGVVLEGENSNKILYGFVDNTAITLSVDNYSDNYETNLGDFTGGHVDNTVKIVISYTVLDAS